MTSNYDLLQDALIRVTGLIIRSLDWQRCKKQTLLPVLERSKTKRPVDICRQKRNRENLDAALNTAAKRPSVQPLANAKSNELNVIVVAVEPGKVHVTGPFP